MIKPYVSPLNVQIPEALREFVVSVILGESDTNNHDSVPVHPTGYPLIIYVFDQIPTLHFKKHSFKASNSLVVAGQIIDEEIRMQINGKLGQIGIVLYPTSPYYLFHKSGTYFLNQWKDLGESCAKPTKRLINDLQNSQVITEQVGLVFEYLEQLIPDSLEKVNWIENALDSIFEANGVVSQEKLAVDASLSLRHFRRKFKDIIGVPPKYYCKVIQLNTIFELLKSNEDDKLHHLALDCGYYDQAHFINDFKKFIGNSPQAFLNGRHEFVKTYLGRNS